MSKHVFTIGPARYAKNMVAVACPSTDGWKTEAGYAAEKLARGRYSHRERCYIMSRRKAVTFERWARIAAGNAE